MEGLIAIALQFAPQILAVILPKLLGGDTSTKAAVDKAVVTATGTSDPDAAKAKLESDAQAVQNLQSELAKIAASVQIAHEQAQTAHEQTQTEQIKATISGEVEKLKAQISDVASARQMMTAMRGSPLEWGAPVISTIVVIGFFAVFAMQALHLTLDAQLTYALQYGFITVLSFWVGSSRGSERKTDLLTLPQPPVVIPPTPVIPPPASQKPPPTPDTPPTPPVSSTTPAEPPPWVTWAIHEVGTKEEPGNKGAAIQRYIDLAHAGEQGDPWCAIFACAALESSGITSTRSPSSQSFRTNANFVQLSGPAYGAIVVYWRNSKNSGLGHVGFYMGERNGKVWTLGGNEGDMVQIEALPKESSTFGLIGYWWPKSVALPTIGAITLPASTPDHEVTAASAAAEFSVISPPTTVPTPAVFSITGVTSTVFGGKSDPNKSAYDSHVITDAELGCALPYHFHGERPKLRVHRNGKSVDVDIVDVGPWYPNSKRGWAADPYWQTGTRPRAETDPATNHAGIDLTPAAAAMIGLHGKGLVDWEFVQAVDTQPAPKVT